ncbi:NUDIX domain-containing protein [Tellurirhabdus rosea]|uniref:NUDIX domain-containing protein n=1 Tax=Tellurirhabdus rosea TaxID=2674997 RepID=UPI00225496E2|nr:NUDIX domain-containing protein [Tellurirhabdus rosea]
MNFCPNCGNPLTPGQAGGRERLVCSASCGYVYWNNPLPVVGAIVEYENNSVLLVQNVGWPKEWYGLVTGFLEGGEEPAAAVLREIREETGLEGQIVEQIGIYTFYQRNELIIAYHVRATGPIQVDPTEIQDYKLVPIDKLKPWPFGTGLAVKDWLGRRMIE